MKSGPASVSRFIKPLNATTPTRAPRQPRSADTSSDLFDVEICGTIAFLVLTSRIDPTLQGKSCRQATRAMVPPQLCLSTHFRPYWEYLYYCFLFSRQT